MTRFALVAVLLATATPFAANAQPVQPNPQALYEQSLSPRAISAVQQRLREQGLYRGRVDGVWGRGTQAALARFQANNRLEVTAQLNPETAKALGLGPDVLLGNTIRGAGALPPVDTVQPVSPRAISAVQRRLRQQGFYHGRSDGAWGRGTQAALIRFQNSRRLEATGHLNAETMRALNLDPALVSGRVAAGVPTPPAQELSRDVVRVVQQRLRGMGFYTGPRDGAWGPRTAEALLGFQTSRGLAATGELTPQTVAALGLDPNNLAASAAARRR